MAENGETALEIYLKEHGLIALNPEQNTFRDKSWRVTNLNDIEKDPFYCGLRSSMGGEKLDTKNETYLNNQYLFFLGYQHGLRKHQNGSCKK